MKLVRKFAMRMCRSAYTTRRYQRFVGSPVMFMKSNKEGLDQDPLNTSLNTW